MKHTNDFLCRIKLHGNVRYFWSCHVLLMYVLFLINTFIIIPMYV